MTLTATVLVTLLNDRRVGRTLESLEAQARVPDRVLVADGGSTDGSLEVARAVPTEAGRVRVEHHPGSVAQTRNSALRNVETDVVAFLDADEVAPPGWLAALLAPIEAGRADFTGGPTRPLAPPASKPERYLNDFEAWFYPNVVARDLTKLPMGNSAWHLRVFRAVGSFDPRLTWGGEDYDVNLRAVRSGFRGEYVPEAWVHHDQGHVRTLRKLMRRKYRYNVGAATAYLKNGVLRERAGAAARTTAKFRHPYELANVVIQPLALARAWWVWRGMR